MSEKNWASQKADEIYIQSSFKPSEYRKYLEDMLAEYDDWKTWRQIGGWCGTVVIENALLEAYKLGKEDTAAELTRLQTIEKAAKHLVQKHWYLMDMDDYIDKLKDLLNKKTPA